MIHCHSIAQLFTLFAIHYNSVLRGGSAEEHDVVFPKASQCKKETRCTLKQLMEHNDISKSSDTLVFDTGGATFCAHYIKVDTKMYGLPQTRNRVYMFVWQPDDGNIHDNLGIYMEAIVRHLQSPGKKKLFLRKHIPLIVC